jgi:Cu/Ag efflux protein CusF
LNETLESSLGGVIGHSAKFGEIQGFARWFDTQQDAIHNGRAERTASARRAAPPRKANMKLHAIHRLHAEPLEANRVTKITANENHNCYSELVCGCFCRREYVFLSNQRRAGGVNENIEAAAGVSGHGGGAGAVTIAHDEIRGFMPAMEVMYQVQDPQLSECLRPGDTVDFSTDAVEHVIVSANLLNYEQ